MLYIYFDWLPYWIHSLYAWSRLSSFIVICLMPYTNALNETFVDLMIPLKMLWMVIIGIFLMNDDEFLILDVITDLTHIVWFMDLDVGSILFSPRGWAYMVFWCLLSIWICSFQYTMCICLFYALFEWLAWSCCMTGVKEDGGRWSGLGERAPWEDHQSFFWDPMDMRTKVSCIRFHTVRDPYGFKFEFYDALRWPCDPHW